MAETISIQSKYIRAGIEYGQIKVYIPSADVLTLNSTPIVAVSAPGFGKVIEPLSAIASIQTYGGNPYASNTRLTISVNANPSLYVAADEGLLLSTNAANFSFHFNNGLLDTNTDMIIGVDAGDPTGGDSDIIVYISYKVIIL